MCIRDRNALCAEVLERAEDRRAAQGADQAMYQRWEALGFPHETILLAASYARGCLLYTSRCV